METEYQKELKDKASEKERLIAELEAKLANEMLVRAEKGTLVKDDFVQSFRGPSLQEQEDAMMRDFRRAKGIKD